MTPGQHNAALALYRAVIEFTRIRPYLNLGPVPHDTVHSLELAVRFFEHEWNVSSSSASSSSSSRG